MPIPAGYRLVPSIAQILFGCALCCTTLAQQTQTLGSIIGHVHVVRGEVPPERVLVTLEVRGGAMDSVYTDSQGTFGFHSLGPNPYYVTVNDEHYEPVRMPAVIMPTSLNPTTFLDIALVPKQPPKEDRGSSPNPAGANPNMIDARDYSARFAKRAVKEFEKGMSADRTGKKDEAIHHYQKAIAIAPDFYFARNNLGSDYLSKSDFVGARKEFEQVVRLNQSDGAAYFNLSNVCMLTGQLPDARRYLEEGMRRQPDSALGHFLLGSLNLHEGKLLEAERALRQAVQLDPVMVQPRLQLVNLFLQQGRKEDAVGELHAFMSTFPDNSFNKQAKDLLHRLETPANATVPPH
jgi:lipopolysaccharide biosynthesis regulator YciM